MPRRCFKVLSALSALVVTLGTGTANANNEAFASG
jgi:hypothetical protein